MEPLPRPGTAMSQRSRTRGMSNDAPEMMPSAPIRTMTPISAYPQSAMSMHEPVAPQISRPGTAMSQRSRGRGYSNDAPETVPVGPSRNMTPTSGHPRSASSINAPTPFELARPGTGMSNRSRGRGYSNEAPEIVSTNSSRNMTPMSGPPGHTQTLPEPIRTRTPGPIHNLYYPPVSPIPEMDGRESPAFPPGHPLRPDTPTAPPPRYTSFGHGPSLPRLRTPSNGGHEGGYMAYNPNQRSSPPPLTNTNESYQSYQSYNPSSANTNAHSFSRPYHTDSGRSTPQGSNLQPPGLYPPERAGSFDDILDHY